MAHQLKVERSKPCGRGFLGVSLGGESGASLGYIINKFHIVLQRAHIFVRSSSALGSPQFCMEPCPRITLLLIRNVCTCAHSSRVVWLLAWLLAWLLVLLLAWLVFASWHVGLAVGLPLGLPLGLLVWLLLWLLCLLLLACSLGKVQKGGQTANCTPKIIFTIF